MPALPRNSSCIFTLNIYCPPRHRDKVGVGRKPAFFIASLAETASAGVYTFCYRNKCRRLLKTRLPL